MTKILIDTEKLRDLNSGLGQFCLHLGHELVRQRPNADWQLTFLVAKGQAGIFGDAVQYREASWHDRLWHTDEFDIWHSTHQNSAYQPARNARLVLTIHDLNYLERPDYSAIRKARETAAVQQHVSRASAVTVISQYTESVVKQQLKFPENVEPQVIYNGASQPPHPSAAQEIPVFLRELPGNESRPFFLFLGIIHPKKNVHVLLPLLEAFPDYQLVLAGTNSHPYAQHIGQQAQKLGVSDRLLMPGAVDEPTKWWLYEHCEAFLFPSLSEGFGLPVVEAMHLGKPVFLSSLTSLPEIGGREAVYFADFEPDTLVKTFRDGMMAFYEDPLKADRLRWQANRFSWEKAAKAYWSVYDTVARKR
jgi:glycosyltransferase involved in cell wall biosynthesis